MREEAVSMLVQREGCKALMSFAFLNNDNKVAIKDAGGIRSLLDAMERFKNDDEVQWWGCRVLHNLALNADNNVAIAEAGGIPPVEQSRSLSRFERWTLYHLAASNGKERENRSVLEREELVTRSTP
jgi:hypothetical protein